MGNLLAIDFDGVLHRPTRARSGFASPQGQAVTGAAKAVRALSVDWRLVVHTCRAASPEGREGVLRWLAAQKLDDLFEDVTAMKPVATAYIDDRSIRFTNWADVLNTFDEGRRWEKGEVV
tara:strand:+ start:1745 stop:2104 length:360 start_codon:yes stop_codon:yes gene_type:complete